MIGVIGARGNMGRRYCAILRHLGKSIMPIDIDNQMDARFEACEGLIIATPTDTHVKLAMDVAQFKLPVLCEKPISKDIQDLFDLKAEYKSPFSMVNQYSFIADGSARGSSYYNFYNHGRDGLKWDCIQIIGLANDDVKLEETSPIWRCAVNGKSLEIGWMDRAYVNMVAHWMAKPGHDFSRLIDIHQKTIEFNID